MSENNENVVVEKAEKVSNEVKADKAKNNAKKKEKKDRTRPFSEMIAELKKVSWPTKEDMRTYAVCVVVFVVICAVILYVMDIGISALIKYISDPDKLASVLNSWFGG